MFSVSSAQTFSPFGKSSDAGFSLSMKRRADVMLVYFYLSILCCSGYYQKIVKWVIVYELYLIHNVIINNSVLIVILYYIGIQCKHFKKSLSNHAKNFVTSQIVEVDRILFEMKTYVSTMKKF